MWLSDWSKRTKITIDNTNIDSNLTHFPIPIFLGTSVGQSSQDMSRIFDEVGANSKKIAVTKDDGETQLYVEIEEWDEAGETAVLWVSKSDWTISSSTTTDLYIYYDNTSDDNTTYVADVGSRTEVWDSNFAMVHHMKDNTTSTILDSTSNNNDGTKKGANEPIEVGGKIAKGQDFDGSNDYISAIDFPDVLGQTFNFSAWIYIEGAGDTTTSKIIAHTDAVADNIFDFTWNNTTKQIGCYFYGTGAGSLIQSGTLNYNTWYHITFTVNSTTQTIYIDGAYNNQRTGTFVYNEDISDIWFGRRYASYTGFYYYLNGRIDETRISSCNRSVAWIKASYYSEDDNLLTFSGEELSLFFDESICLSDSNNLNIPTEIINIIESIYLGENSELTPITLNSIIVNETLYLADSLKSSLIEEFLETLTISDSNSINIDEELSYATQILSYNPLIILTGLDPVKLVHVDISTPTSPIVTAYEVTTITNAKDIVLNDTSEYFYLGGSNGIIVKIEKADLSNQTVINTGDSDDFQKITSLDDFFKTFGSTDDENGEIVMVDESEIKVLNTDLRFIAQIESIINTQLNTIFGYILNTDFRFIATQSYKINTDLRFLKYSYSTISRYPINYEDYQLKINGTDLCPLNDVDMKSIIITHTMDDESIASFTLNRRHDKLDYDNQGNSSQITNQNDVKIYIDSHLEFDGYISNLEVDSENETVTVTATMEQPSDMRQIISIPLPSVNEQLHPYHCLLNSSSIQNPVIDSSSVITSDSGLFWDGDDWVGNINKALEFATHALAQTYIDNTLITKENSQNYVVEDADENNIILSQQVYPTNKNQNPKYYKGIAVNLGTEIEQNIIALRWILDTASLATKLEEGTFEPVQNRTYFWLAKFEKFLVGKIQTTLSYLGTSLGSLATDAYKITGASYYTQKILEDVETDLGWYYLGSAPYKEISVTNGRKITKNKWTDKNDGLYRIKDEGYDYEQFAKDIASIEYNKIKTINDEILPVTSANIDISFDAYYYYTIKLLTRLNITNTTTPNIYKNLNGFPLAVKSISINFSNMKISLNCSNQKSLTELQEADDTYPDKNSDEYLFPEESAKIHSKFDPNKWGYIT